MVRRKLMGLLVCTLALSLASFAWAGVPDLGFSTLSGAMEPVQVSVYSLPNGAGHGLDDVYVLGGVKVNATVTVTLLDSNLQPVFNYPFEDLWVDSSLGGIVYCPGGTTADANTDANGQTTFTNALFAGLSSDPLATEGLVVMVSGVPMSRTLPYHFNSPDMDGDLIVNLTDVVIFAGIYYGAYEYKADFYWDLTINLSDIVLLAQGMGAECP